MPDYGNDKPYQAKRPLKGTARRQDASIKLALPARRSKAKAAASVNNAGANPTRRKPHSGRANGLCGGWTYSSCEWELSGFELNLVEFVRPKGPQRLEAQKPFALKLTLNGLKDVPIESIGVTQKNRFGLH